MKFDIQVYREDYIRSKKQFDEMCEQKGIVGIKGHRSVGGYRASLYNALEIGSVNVLVDIIKNL